MSTLDTWANPSYCWVVICKNARAHRETNMMFGHKIPLGETDAFEPLPVYQIDRRIDLLINLQLSAQIPMVDTTK
jgi:hypothetical protein